MQQRNRIELQRGSSVGALHLRGVSFLVAAIVLTLGASYVDTSAAPSDRLKDAALDLAAAVAQYESDLKAYSDARQAYNLAVNTYWELIDQKRKS